MISLILPVFLGKYPNVAKDIANKFYTCLDNIEAQTNKDYELIVVADGCPDAVNIVKDQGLKCEIIHIKKQPLFSCVPRNVGIEAAKGEWIAYIDADDLLGVDHIEILSKQLTLDWHWFNDYVPNAKKEFYERPCDVNKKGMCGTSNIVHRKDLNVTWPAGYLHDWEFIQQLKKYPFTKIETPQYYVRHIPGKFDI